MKPRWMRRHIACPDCGHIYTEEGLNAAMPGQFQNWPASQELIFPKGFNCVKCKAHYTHDEFWQEQEEKWDRTMREEA